MVIKRIAKAAIFFVLLGVILSGIQTVMVTPSYKARQFVSDFYNEKSNTLDAVFLGSSDTYNYWNAPYAWNKYGLTVHPLATASQPFEVAEYLIKEAQKTQPRALYIVQISNLSLSNPAFHRVADVMPLSLNKIQMVQTVGDYLEIDLSEKIEYLFPLIGYHNRWNELNERDFFNPGYKGAPSDENTSYWTKSTDITSDFRTTEDTGELEEHLQNSLESLLDYCEQEHLDVLFVNTPKAKSKSQIARINTVKETIEARGYTVLDMQWAVEDADLDLATDFYDTDHTNIHGAIKVTDYIANYLLEHYEFVDKRRYTRYKSWNDAFESYSREYALANVIDVVWEGEPRDFTLSVPALKIEVKEDTVTVMWRTVSDADGYRVYRRLGSPSESPWDARFHWEDIATIEAGQEYYITDKGLEASKTYYYTVVPYRDEDGIRYWGNYQYRGISAAID